MKKKELALLELLRFRITCKKQIPTPLLRPSVEPPPGPQNSI